MSLGERLKEQRNKSGFSQEKVAELVGVSRQAVTKWETGQSAPSTANLITLSEIYGVSLGELISGVSESPPSQNATEPGSAVEKNRTAKNVFLVFAIIFAFVGIVAVAVINNMNAIDISRVFGVMVTSVNTLRLVVTLVGVKFILIGVGLLMAYFIKMKER